MVFKPISHDGLAPIQGLQIYFKWCVSTRLIHSDYQSDLHVSNYAKLSLKQLLPLLQRRAQRLAVHGPGVGVQPNQDDSLDAVCRETALRVVHHLGPLAGLLIV